MAEGGFDEPFGFGDYQPNLAGLCDYEPNPNFSVTPPPAPSALPVPSDSLGPEHMRCVASVDISAIAATGIIALIIFFCFGFISFCKRLTGSFRQPNTTRQQIAQHRGC